MPKQYVLAGYIADQMMGIDPTLVLMAMADNADDLRRWLENCHWNDEDQVIFSSKAGNTLLIRDPYIEFIH